MAHVFFIKTQPFLCPFSYFCHMTVFCKLLRKLIPTDRIYKKNDINVGSKRGKLNHNVGCWGKTFCRRNKGGATSLNKMSRWIIYRRRKTEREERW